MDLCMCVEFKLGVSIYFQLIKGKYRFRLCLAFTRAWKNACAWQGKMTRILIPKGIFLVGALVFEAPCKSTVIFNVKGAVKAPTDLNKFKDDVWIHFKHIHGLLITGGGTFDGQGASAWPHNYCDNNLNCKLLPTSIKLSFVNGAKVSSISSINSKFFHMNIYKSKKIKMKIGTGDDCISVGPGSYKVTITNIDCGPGHGISVGSLGRYAGEDNVMGLEVKNCVLRGTTNGLRIKTWANSSPSLTSDFLFENYFFPAAF
ncbi:Glycoside hydrolase [Cinnamomum micranthum f. kanehirae]|uniref:Glycoside hydrolase n=1 Tax=Cinnamomum micranthum f. kanehirae TaxID=337451 RepID=A0A3S3NBG2_9MAGN|nr:Glycoside hydrolase [Cinnamomum micranthum f. kanehirae]